MKTNIKQKIKSAFAGQYAVSLLHCAESKIVPMLIDDETAVKCYYKKCTGNDLNLNNPQTFSEKLNWYKLNHHDPLMQRCADKIAVREYVKSKGYGENLNELLGIYDNANDINLDLLPNQFVLKASHGSHMNTIVKDKGKINWRQQRLLMNSWLRQDIYWSGREWVYKDIPKRIIAEKYLEDETGELKDFKFFCFHGHSRFVQFESGRYSLPHIRNFYDMEWNLLPFGKEIFPCTNVKIAKPNCFQDMLCMAEHLSRPFQFARVDMYEVNQKVYFGEITFFPAGGANDFQPPEYDLNVGKYWILEE